MILVRSYTLTIGNAIVAAVIAAVSTAFAQERCLATRKEIGSDFRHGQAHVLSDAANKVVPFDVK